MFSVVSHGPGTGGVQLPVEVGGGPNATKLGMR